MDSTLMLVGSRTNDPSKPVHLNAEGLLHHTLVVGQSGSGKSFFVARLVEEILLATKARVIIVDPNGDFRSLSQGSEAVWVDLGERLSELGRISGRKPNFDSREVFDQVWGRRRFLNLHPAAARLPTDTSMALHRKLVMHWDSIDEDDRDFLLRGASSTTARTLLGLEACVDAAKYFSVRPNSGYGNDLRGLINAAEQFAARNLSLRQYPYAKDLGADDWYAVRATLSELVRRHAIWWSRVLAIPSAVRPPGLSDFIDGPFEGAPPSSETAWDVLSLSLDAVRETDSLLVVNSALSRLWRNAKAAWRASNREPMSIDERVPTFVVIDEAQNYAPARTGNPLRARVTEQLIQIAAEGRKYGVYLILATQRPTKLHPELVPECENSCLLRVQSRLDTEFASSALGISSNLAINAPSFRKGQGLISGRWIDNEVAIDARFAPARSIVGGAGLPSSWARRTSASEPFAERETRVRDGVRKELLESQNPIALVGLAQAVRSRFPEVDDETWEGHFGFKAFLLSLNIDGLVVTSEPPGYAYLRGVHEAPGPIGASTEWHDSYPGAGEPGARTILSALHRDIGLPILETEEFLLIYEALSEVLQEQSFNLRDTSKAVRDSLAERGLPIGRTAIGYVIKGISWSGHRFDSDLPQDPRSLAAAFCRQLARSVASSSISEGAAIESAISYCSGGLLKPMEVAQLRSGLTIQTQLRGVEEDVSSSPPAGGVASPESAVEESEL